MVGNFFYRIFDGFKISKKNPAAQCYLNACRSLKDYVRLSKIVRDSPKCIQKPPRLRKIVETHLKAYMIVLKLFFICWTNFFNIFLPLKKSKILISPSVKMLPPPQQHASASLTDIIKYGERPIMSLWKFLRKMFNKIPEWLLYATEWTCMFMQWIFNIKFNILHLVPLWPAPHTTPTTTTEFDKCQIRELNAIPDAETAIGHSGSE